MFEIDTLKKMKDDLTAKGGNPPFQLLVHTDMRDLFPEREKIGEVFGMEIIADHRVPKGAYFVAEQGGGSE